MAARAQVIRRHLFSRSRSIGVAPVDARQSVASFVLGAAAFFLRQL
jgi:hypothetical protein